MALDPSQYISTLDEDSPFNIDPRSEGAGQIRSIKRAVRQSFPNISGEVTATQDQLNYLVSLGTIVAQGMIMMWNGDTAAGLPVGWVVCDGNGGEAYSTELSGPYFVPDLRNQFIKGAHEDIEGIESEDPDIPDYPSQPAENVGDEGGEHYPIVEDGTFEIGGTSLTEEQIPPHTHPYLTRGDAGTGSRGSSSSGRLMELNPTDNRNTSPNSSGESGVADTHTHTISSGSQRVGNQPGYYVLTYIIYIGPLAA